jgi:N-acetylneuraminate lyase
LYGVDQQLLPALTLGAKAAIGSTYNYNGKLNNKLIAAFERGDLTTAQKEQSRSQATVRIMKKYGKLVGEIAVGKAIMQLIGMNIGPVRLPDTGLLPDQLKELRKDLNEIGFFDWQ